MRYQVSSKEHDGSSSLLLKAPYNIYIPDTKKAACSLQFNTLAPSTSLSSLGSLVCLSSNMFFQHRLLSGATRSPETARQRQVPRTKQPSRSPAKEGAPQPNSVSDDFSRLLSRRRQVISTFSVGSTAERSILDRAPIESPRLCVFAFFSAVILLHVLLLYTHGGIVGC